MIKRYTFLVMIGLSVFLSCNVKPEKRESLIIQTITVNLSKEKYPINQKPVITVSLEQDHLKYYTPITENEMQMMWNWETSASDKVLFTLESQSSFELKVYDYQRPQKLSDEPYKILYETEISLANFRKNNSFISIEDADIGLKITMSYYFRSHN